MEGYIPFIETDPISVAYTEFRDAIDANDFEAERHIAANLMPGDPGYEESIKRLMFAADELSRTQAEYFRLLNESNAHPDDNEITSDMVLGWMQAIQVGG